MPDSDAALSSELSSGGPDRGKTAFRIGIALILFSCVLWFSLFAIPFLPLTVGQRTVSAAAVFVAVQITWWSGAAFVGPKTVARLWPWRRKAKPDA